MKDVNPKVYIPAAIQLVAGIVLVVLGAVLPDETLRGIGYGALGSGLTTFGVGYQVPSKRSK
jgi:hypothetical protein